MTWRFWITYPGLCFSSFLCALETSILSTALPTIVHDLGSASLYTWAANSYTLAFTAVQPLYGQAADVFGRKAALVTALLLFASGSVACALARATPAFVAGRALQGVGGGGLSILPAMVVCDLASLRRRQTYVGIVNAAFALGAVLGPVLGGVFAERAFDWPWIFWLNLPLAGTAMVLITAFLRVHTAHPANDTLRARLTRIDYTGCACLIVSVVAVLYALSTAGAGQAWRSWQVLVPLLLGLCLGLPLYICYETSSWCRHPMMSPRLFTNRTSVLAFALTFVHGILLYFGIYFLPVYFQAVFLATPEQSGVDLLPFFVPLVPVGIVGGILISATGRYKPNQLLGYAVIAIAFGCFTLLNQSTPTRVWLVLELTLAAGHGAVLTSLLPAIQAPLPESDVAATTATWGFVQSLGFVCGIAIPVSIFNTRVDDLLPAISDASVRHMLGAGNAYEHSIRLYMTTLPTSTQSQVIAIFVTALKAVWQVALAFALLGFAISLCIKQVPLREVLDTEYGYKENLDVDSDNRTLSRDSRSTTEKLSDH